MHCSPSWELLWELQISWKCLVLLLWVWDPVVIDRSEFMQQFQTAAVSDWIRIQWNFRVKLRSLFVFQIHSSTIFTFFHPREKGTCYKFSSVFTPQPASFHAPLLPPTSYIVQHTLNNAWAEHSFALNIYFKTSVVRKNGVALDGFHAAFPPPSFFSPSGLEGYMITGRNISVWEESSSSGGCHWSL